METDVTDGFPQNGGTPWKINMEPTNHPFGKEYDVNQTSMVMFHVNLQGCKEGSLPQTVFLNCAGET